MTLLEELASEVTAEIAKTYQYFTVGARADIKSLIVNKFREFVPDPQRSLSFEDAKVNAAQAGEILALLKGRRSAGATSMELSKHSLKYTGRVSDLRKQGYRIRCTRESGRTFRYMLSPEMW